MVSVGEKLGFFEKPEFEFVTMDDGKTQITRTSIFTKRRNTMVLPIQQADVIGWRSGGRLVQDVFPHLSADEREFLMSGATPEEWAGMFGSPEEAES